MSEHVSWLQRKLFISKLQAKIIAYATSFSVAASFLTAAFMKMYYNSFVSGDPLESKEFMVIFGSGLAIFMVLLTAGLVLTNHICGPLFRLHRQIKEIEKGQRPPPLRLRKHDDFAELVEDFNRLVKRLTEG